MNSKLNKWEKLVCIVVVLAAIVVLVGFFLPITEQVDIQMHGYEVLEDGSVIQEGDVTIQGTRYKYLFRDDQVRFKSLRFFGADFADMDSNSTKYFPADDEMPYDRIFPYISGQGFFNARIFIDPDQQWCCAALLDLFEEEDHFYVVSSAAADTDIAQITAQCDLFAE